MSRILIFQKFILLLKKVLVSRNSSREGNILPYSYLIYFVPFFDKSNMHNVIGPMSRTNYIIEEIAAK